jgi:hypothetical protein
MAAAQTGEPTGIPSLPIPPFPFLSPCFVCVRQCVYWSRPSSSGAVRTLRRSGCFFDLGPQILRSGIVIGRGVTIGQAVTPAGGTVKFGGRSPTSMLILP